MSDRPLVLLVEDNPRSLKLARDVLEFAGFTVVIAGSGEDGVALAASALPDLILMDIQLPGIDGYAALEEIRGNHATARIPVVALTAFAMARDRDRVLSSGFDGYLEKQINVRDFPTEVRRHLHEAQGPQRAHRQSSTRRQWLTEFPPGCACSSSTTSRRASRIQAVVEPRGFTVLLATSGERHRRAAPLKATHPELSKNNHRGRRGGSGGASGRFRDPRVHQLRHIVPRNHGQRLGVAAWHACLQT